MPRGRSNFSDSNQPRTDQPGLGSAQIVQRLTAANRGVLEATQETSKELIEGATVDLICYIKTSDQIAITGMSQNRVRIYQCPSLEFVMPLGQDHVRTMTGLIEIQCIVPPPPNSSASDGEGAPRSQAPIVQPMFVTCSLDGSIVLYEIKAVEG